ncbi:MAG: right-handed parallel beta-helix repeat-containing protein [Novosphingobium sp.]|nr:right-handed parallel beta-helix repeat-containing protein [Novosphingobium sp.]
MQVVHRLRKGTLAQAARLLFALVLAAICQVTPANAGTGTALDPYTSLSEAYKASASGRYFFNLGSGTFAASIDTSEGGGWVLVLQYVRPANTNPALAILGAGANLPVQSTAALGANESSDATRWGHAGNAAMNQFTGSIETRWYGISSGHARVIHFRTAIGASYLRTGIGTMDGVATSFTALTGHTGFLPAAATSSLSNRGNLAMTDTPFRRTAFYKWALGVGNDWEVDDDPANDTNSTINRVWVRAVDPPSGLVVNTNNSGPGSLRDAIVWANANSGADTITFNIAGAGPHTITLTSALAALTGNGDSIDGTTQPGTQCRDLWAGAGHDLRINLRGSSSFDGVQLGGTNQTVKGLSITGFDQAIRLLPASNTATVQCNYLGLLANGTSSGNTRGVWVNGASARIGGLSAGQGNVIAANSTTGVLTVQSSSDTAIRGNFIGTDSAGTAARANGTAINHFSGSGTWRDITGNLISGNGAGIVLDTDDAISASTDQVYIQRNRIGFNRTLGALLANGTGAAIQFSPGSIGNVLIGGSASTDANEIAGGRDGIVLQGISNIRIRGNTIARSGSRGIWVENASNIAIGGTGANEGNAIGGNGSDGIRVGTSSSNITILGNLIQPVTITGGTFANNDHGIWIDGASNVSIGDGTAAGRNVIGGNRRRGIQGSSTNSTITINGNYIGTDATGNVAVANGQNEGSATKDAISFDNLGNSTNDAILNNVIGGYDSALIEFWNSTGNGITVQGNRIGVGANGTSSIMSSNLEDLIYMGGGGTYSNVLIGGSAPGQGNTLANSARSGIRLDTTGSNIQVIGNTIRNNTRNGIYLVGSTRAALVSNSIYANGMIGIDLGENGVTLNDAGDGDTGANDLLNFPQIGSIHVTGSNALQYRFTLDAPAAASGYRIEFFANSSADPSGFGEGERYLGHVDITHAGGAQAFSGTLTTLSAVAIGDIVSATATRRTAGGAWDTTSEFSAVATAEGLAQLTLDMTSGVFEPPADNPFAAPGNDIVLTTSISNVGTGSTDQDSIFAVISLAATNSFYNAPTPAFGGVVGFTSPAPGLTFTAGGDLGFSNSTTAPTAFAQCTYQPQPGYDPQVRHVCINPKGRLPNGLPQGVLTLKLRAKIS